jgi:hypothetical protein
MAIAASSALVVGGCSMLSGLDQLHEVACVRDCDGAPLPDDATVDAGPSGADRTAEGPRPDASLTDVAPQPADDGAPDESASVDADEAGGPNEASDGTQTFSTANADALAANDGAGAQTDCGPIDTVQNCGACGAACALASASVTASACTANRCSYTCSSGHLDCNASLTPNVDGCECAIPTLADAGCCGVTCPVQHTANLVSGPVFFDCVAAG